jgi:uncharacterized membrane protein YccC
VINLDLVLLVFLFIFLLFFFKVRTVKRYAGIGSFILILLCNFPLYHHGTYETSNLNLINHFSFFLNNF